MAIRVVVAVTDSDWFDSLRNRHDLAEVNFWAPSGASFKALQPGELFLFKLLAAKILSRGRHFRVCELPSVLIGLGSLW